MNNPTGIPEIDERVIEGRPLFVLEEVVSEDSAPFSWIFTTQEDAAATFAAKLVANDDPGIEALNGEYCLTADDYGGMYYSHWFGHYELRLTMTHLLTPNFPDRAKAVQLAINGYGKDDDMDIPACPEVWETYDGVRVEASVHIPDYDLGWWRCENCERKYSGATPDHWVENLIVCPECEATLVFSAVQEWERRDA